MLSALGLRLKEVGEALASGIEFKGTPKNSVTETIKQDQKSALLHYIGA